MINELIMLTSIIAKRSIGTDSYYEQPRKKAKLSEEAM